jgi:hypothetical protein
MRIYDEMIDTVCFLGSYDPRIGKPIYKGTGFFVWLSDKHVTVVTARHVIDEVPGDEVSIWWNQKSGNIRNSFSKSLWLNHPIKDTAVDVAVLGVALNHEELEMDHKGFVSENFLNEKQEIEREIGAGDVVYFPGLFVAQAGKERNHPIVREGIIAAMPQPISTIVDGEETEVEAYLVEVRSFGGLSGSPVVVTSTPFRRSQHPAPEEFADGIKVFQDALIGLVHGHDFMEYIVPAQGMQRFNLGLCKVVPIRYVSEILNGDEMKKVVSDANAGAITGDQGIRASLDGASIEDDSLTKTADLVIEVLEQPKKKGKPQ